MIIANPGNSGSSTYLPGVDLDVENYRDFLKSPIGGAWLDNEIQTLYRSSLKSVERALGRLQASDYSIIIFSGHGEHSEHLDTTMLELNDDDIFDSMDLREGANKRSIIIDCCRIVAKPLRIKLAELAKANPPSRFNATECRTWYDAQIEECTKGVVVCHSCDVGESAGDDETRGGYYSYDLIMASREWYQSGSFDTTNEYYIYSIVDAHLVAKERTARRSGGTQNPVIEKPRTKIHFPFAVVA